MVWMGDTLAAQGRISPEDRDLSRVVDEIAAVIGAYHRRPDHAAFHLPSGA